MASCVDDRARANEFLGELLDDFFFFVIDLVGLIVEGP
jgi:hypothetical protein